MSLTPGYTTCVEVTAFDKVGNRSPAAVRCSEMPLDDRSLTRSGSWTSYAPKSAYRATTSSATAVGAKLTYTGVKGNHLVVVYTAVPGGGKIGVYVGGVRIAVISTASTTTVYKKTYTLARTMNGVSVTLRVESSGSNGVALDGLGVTWV